MKSTELLSEIRALFGKQWNIRKGFKVPEAMDIAQGNDAVSISGAVLYSDLVDSTGLVNGFKSWFSAEVYKTFLYGACRVIKEQGGVITAFDGDRVMAVFKDGDYNTNAVTASLQINFLVSKINEIIRATYPTTSFTLRQRVGIDSGDLLVAKTGIWKYNDLVWIGRAANYAAKLATIDEPGFTTYVTENVYATLKNEVMYSASDKSLLWERRNWLAQKMTIYRTNAWWTF